MASLEPLLVNPDGSLISNRLSDACAVAEQAVDLSQSETSSSRVRAALVKALNSDDKEVSIMVKEKCTRLIANLSLYPQNSGWVISTLGELNSSFETSFETEELYNSARALGTTAELHLNILIALLRVMDTQITARSVLEMLKSENSQLQLAVGILLGLVARSAHEPDAAVLACHATRILFQLTVFDTYFDAEACESLKDLKAATSTFQRKNNDLIHAVITHAVFDVLKTSFGSEAGRSGGAAVLQALRLLHNLLLYSTERSAQLRKHIAASGFVPGVLDPFLQAHLQGLQAAPPEGSGGAGAEGEEVQRRGGAVRAVLEAMCVATFKVGTLRAHYLEAPLLPAALAVPCLARSPAVVHLAARIACNLGLLQPYADPACPAARGQEAIRAGLVGAVEALPPHAREQARRRFHLEVPALPVFRDNPTHGWLAGPALLPPPPAAAPRGPHAPPAGPAASAPAPGPGAASAADRSRRRRNQRRRKQQKDARAQPQGPPPGPNGGGGRGKGKGRGRGRGKGRGGGGHGRRPQEAAGPHASGAAAEAGEEEEEDVDVEEEKEGVEAGSPSIVIQCGAVRRVEVQSVFRLDSSDEDADDDDDGAGAGDFEVDAVLDEIDAYRAQLVEHEATLIL